MKKASKITDAERSEIDILHTKGYSARAIAQALGRSPNTIAAELKRNSYKDGRYEAARAKQKAYVRRKYARYQVKKIQDNDELRSFIIAKLSEHWNPDEIAGYMKRHVACSVTCGEVDCTGGANPLHASKTAIYEWLRSAWGQQHCDLLYSKRYNRKPRQKNKTDRVMIPDRTSITERPLAALDRGEIGHCEYDSVVSSKRSGSAVALYAQTVTRLSRGLNARTMTTDNGIENKQHALVTKKTGVPVFFTDPYSSWQKGGVENANKMLRRYFPKGTDFATVS